MSNGCFLSDDQAEWLRRAAKDRLDERKWGPTDLAEQTGFSREEISKRLSGSKAFK